MIGYLDKVITRLLHLIQGGGESLQSIKDDLATGLDIARSPQSGQLVMTGAADQILYEETGDPFPFEYLGGWIDWTGLNAGAGENTTINVYIKIKTGGTYHLVYSEVFLAAAVPVPAITAIPRAAATDPEPVRFLNVYGVKVCATQAAIGAGWNTLDYCWYDAKRGA